MPDERTAATSSDEDGRSSGWFSRLQQLLRLSQPAPSLRERLEDAIDDAEDEPSGPGGAAAADADGDLSPIERKMLRNLLHFGEKNADDLCVPRGDIVAVPDTIGFAEMVALFADAGHSRLPVYHDALDNIIGMVHIKDVFAALATGGPPPAMDALLRQPLYVPQAMNAIDLLADMRAARTHLAIVIDEYGGTEGLVTIEDLVEAIVGDIEDEHDDAPVALFSPLGDGSWRTDARAELEEIGEAIAAQLAETDEDVDTIGGLAALLAGHVPRVGEVVEHPSGWRLEITEGDERRVQWLRLHPPAADAGDPA